MGSGTSRKKAPSSDTGADAGAGVEQAAPIIDRPPRMGECKEMRANSRRGSHFDINSQKDQPGSLHHEHKEFLKAGSHRALSSKSLLSLNDSESTKSLLGDNAERLHLNDEIEEKHQVGSGATTNTTAAAAAKPADESADDMLANVAPGDEELRARLEELTHLGVVIASSDGGEPEANLEALRDHFKDFDAPCAVSEIAPPTLEAFARAAAWGAAQAAAAAVSEGEGNEPESAPALEHSESTGSLNARQGTNKTTMSTLPGSSAASSSSMFVKRRLQKTGLEFAAAASALAQLTAKYLESNLAGDADLPAQRRAMQEVCTTMNALIERRKEHERFLVNHCGSSSSNLLHSASGTLQIVQAEDSNVQQTTLEGVSSPKERTSPTQEQVYHDDVVSPL